MNLKSRSALQCRLLFSFIKHQDDNPCPAPLLLSELWDGFIIPTACVSLGKAQFDLPVAIRLQEYRASFQVDTVAKLTT